VKLAEFAEMVPGFDSLAPRDMICHFGWYLHVQGGKQTFVTQDIGRCYKELDMVAPNISQYLTRLVEIKPPDVMRNKTGFKLARPVRIDLDRKYTDHPTTVTVSKVLAELPAKVPDLAERAFLEEAIKCYKARAYRATVVMVWNLAYDHLMHWILADPNKLAALNAALAKRFQKRPPTVAKLQDFEDIKEFDVVEVCGTAEVLGSNTVRILKDKLTKRNMSGHPSTVVVTQHQADDAITDLVNNVVLQLK
jgi:hypothetical protein